MAQSDNSRKSNIRPKLSLRITASILLPCQLFVTFPIGLPTLLAAGEREIPPQENKGPDQAASIPAIHPNHTVHETPAPGPFSHFSSEPTSDEISTVRVFEEPLIFVGHQP